jgi:trk system potassium uptake protein TrkA
MRFCIIGLGTFGTHLARQLSREGHEIVAADNHPSRINALKEEIEYLILADCTDLNAFHEIPVDECDAVILAIGEDFEASLSVAANLQQLGAKRIISRLEIGGGYEVAQVLVPSRMVGQTLQEQNLRGRYSLNLITIAKGRSAPALSSTHHPINRVLGIPQPERIFEEDDILVLFGQIQDVRRMMRDHEKR